jgi:hypothetical protein
VAPACQVSIAIPSGSSAERGWLCGRSPYRRILTVSVGLDEARTPTADCLGHERVALRGFLFGQEEVNREDAKVGNEEEVGKKKRFTAEVAEDAEI